MLEELRSLTSAGSGEMKRIGRRYVMDDLSTAQAQSGFENILLIIDDLLGFPRLNLPFPFSVKSHGFLTKSYRLSSCK